MYIIDDSCFIQDRFWLELIRELRSTRWHSSHSVDSFNSSTIFIIDRKLTVAQVALLTLPPILVINT